MKKLILSLISVLVLNFSLKADGVPIEVNQLPQEAQTFIKQYFSDKVISLVTKDTEYFDQSYDVYFTNGNKVEFNKRGEWKEVDCRGSAVPAQIVPSQISNWVSSKYPNQMIVQIDKKRSTGGYEIKLSNQIELEFNQQFHLIEIDD